MKRRFNTLVLVLSAALAALCVVLAFFIHFPIIPGLAFLEYDPADILIYVSTYVFGIPVGLAITVVVSIVQGVTVSASSGVTGIAMHVLSTGGFVLAAGLVYFLTGRLRKKEKHRTLYTILSLAAATAAGILTVVALMTAWNIILTPIFMGIERDILIRQYLGLIVLFNLIKASINGVAAAVFTVPFGMLAKTILGGKNVME